MFGSSELICIVKERIPGVDVTCVRHRLNWPDWHTEGRTRADGAGKILGEASRTVLNSAVANLITERTVVADRLRRKCFLGG